MDIYKTRLDVQGATAKAMDRGSTTIGGMYREASVKIAAGDAAEVFRVETCEQDVVDAVIVVRYQGDDRLGGCLGLVYYPGEKEIAIPGTIFVEGTPLEWAKVYALAQANLMAELYDNEIL